MISLPTVQSGDMSNNNQLQTLVQEGPAQNSPRATIQPCFSIRATAAEAKQQPPCREAVFLHYQLPKILIEPIQSLPLPQKINFALHPVAERAAGCLFQTQLLAV